VHRSDSERIIETPPFEDADRETTVAGPLEITLRRRVAPTCEFPWPLPLAPIAITSSFFNGLAAARRRALEKEASE
jgi:hypothetical protein